MVNRLYYVFQIVIFISFFNVAYAQITSNDAIEKFIFSLDNDGLSQKQDLELIFTPSLYDIIKKHKANLGNFFNIIQSCRNNNTKKLNVASINLINKDNNQAIVILNCNNKITEQIIQKFTLEIYILKQNNAWLIDNIVKLDEVSVRSMIDREAILEKDTHE